MTFTVEPEYDAEEGSKIEFKKRNVFFFCGGGGGGVQDGLGSKMWEEVSRVREGEKMVSATG